MLPLEVRNIIRKFELRRILHQESENLFTLETKDGKKYRIEITEVTNVFEPAVIPELVPEPIPEPIFKKRIKTPTPEPEEE